MEQQLKEANRKAQEYRQQLLRKEQEAEQYRLKLEAITIRQTNGNCAEPQEEVVLQEEEEEEVVGGEEVVMFSEGTIIIKEEALDSTEGETVTFVDAADITATSEVTP